MKRTINGLFLIAAFITAVAFVEAQLLMTFVGPPSTARYCYEAQVYTDSPYGAVLVGDQEVCLGSVTGPSKKGQVH